MRIPHWHSHWDPSLPCRGERNHLRLTLQLGSVVFSGNLWQSVWELCTVHYGLWQSMWELCSAQCAPSTVTECTVHCDSLCENCAPCQCAPWQSVWERLRSAQPSSLLTCQIARLSPCPYHFTIFYHHHQYLLVKLKEENAMFFLSALKWAFNSEMCIIHSSANHWQGQVEGAILQRICLRKAH